MPIDTPRVQLASHVTYDVRLARRPQTHDWHELLYVLRGELRVDAEGDWHSAPGSGVLIPAGTRHLAVMPYDGSVAVMVLQWTGPTPLDQVTVIVDPDHRIGLMLQWIHDLAGSPDDASAGPYRDHLLAALLSECRLRRSDAAQSVDPIERARRFLVDNLPYDLHRDDVCAITGLAPSQATRRFRQRFGQAPMAYLRRLRAERAMQLLETTTWTTARIAGATGLGSPAYLSRVLKEVLGRTPRQLRQRAAARPGSA